MIDKCLYCYQPLNGEIDFHEKCSNQFFGTHVPPTLNHTLEEMTELAKSVVERSESVPGVQPKLSLSALKEIAGNTQQRLTVFGALVGNYILKPLSEFYPEMPANEHVTMRIAEAFGIKVVASSLIRLKSGQLTYLTQRIDRTKKGDKIHMLDLLQITEAFDKYKSSMEKVGKAILENLENTLLDALNLFELILFCFLTGNNDMHLKNFSIIKSSSGWVLAPAYDLLNVTIANPSDKEELALTLGGKKKKLNRTYFERFGKELGMTNKQIESVFNRLAKNKAKAVEWIQQSFLSDELKEDYLELLEVRYQHIF
jgi:serine/threonine-protein kinase HipA